MAMNYEWKYFEFKEVGSTNDKIREYCQSEGQCVVVRADTQTAGRGRWGRSWQSEAGNLFFSAAFEFDIKEAGKLAFICSLSLLQALKKIAPSADILLKWPNDVLLNGAKVSGILLEKGEGNYIIAGIGVNVAVAPKVENAVYKITSLADAAIKTTAPELMLLFMESFSQNLSLLQTKGFAVLRTEWLKYAKNLGKEIIVRQNGKEWKGVFAGIDEDAVLLMQTPAGVRKILAGDVFFEEIK